MHTRAIFSRSTLCGIYTALYDCFLLLFVVLRTRCKCVFIHTLDRTYLSSRTGIEPIKVSPDSESETFIKYLCMNGVHTVYFITGHTTWKLQLKSAPNSSGVGATALSLQPQAHSVAVQTATQSLAFLFHFPKLVPWCSPSPLTTVTTLCSNVRLGQV